MSVCQHRPEPGGMFTTCHAAGGCKCAAELTPHATPDRAATDEDPAGAGPSEPSVAAERSERE